MGQGGGVYILKTEIKDAERGIVAIRRIQPEGPITDIPSDGELLIRQFGKVVVANYTEGKGKGHSFGRVVVANMSFTLFTPDVPEFVKLIEDKTLEGKVAPLTCLEVENPRVRVRRAV